MKTFLNWSGGKDSALCLHTAKQQGLAVEALVTSVNQSTERVSMHGVRKDLLQAQAKALGLPLHLVSLPAQPDMKVYEQSISESNQLLKAQGFTHVASGDLFLEDLKTYREQLYAKDDLECLFPIWNLDTKKVMQQFVALGFKAIIVCVNAQVLYKSFCGRLLDESFINDLPDGVDICGERGEYHSFVFDGPIFKSPVSFTKGEIMYKEYPAPKNEDCFTEPQPAAGFYFQDLIIAP